MFVDSSTESRFIAQCVNQQGFQYPLSVVMINTKGDFMVMRVEAARSVRLVQQQIAGGGTLMKSPLNLFVTDARGEASRLFMDAEDDGREVGAAAIRET